MSIQKIISIHFEKKQGTSVDIISTCSRIISGLKSDEHVCIHTFNWGNKGNTLIPEEVSGTIISYFAKLKFCFADEKEEKRIEEELKFYLKEITPKEVRFSVF